MAPDTQSILKNDRVTMIPLREDGFEELFAVASDHKIWEQHPNKNRWKRDVFQVFYEGALQSKGAYKIVENESGAVIGSTRFYEFDESLNRILIGYTFYAPSYWGTGVNHSVKKLMLDHIFEFVDTVHFHVGSENYRSQVSISRIGARKVGEKPVAYHGEQPRMNFEYEITRSEWKSRGE